MFTIKVIKNDNTEKVMSFSDFSRKAVIAKYNQLLRIEEYLEDETVFAGKSAFKFLK